MKRLEQKIRRLKEKHGKLILDTYLSEECKELRKNGGE